MPFRGQFIGLPSLALPVPAEKHPRPLAPGGPVGKRVGQLTHEFDPAENERDLLRDLTSDRQFGSLARLDFSAGTDEIALTKSKLLAPEEHFLAAEPRPKQVADAHLR